MTLQPNLESILNKVNNFINIDALRQRYAEHFANLQNIIFAELRNNEVFGYIFNGFQMGGSYGDNAKVTVPNEYDMIFHIKFPEQSMIIVTEDHDLPGNIFLDFSKVLQKIANEKQHAKNLERLKCWLDKDNMLKVESFQAYLQSCFYSVLTSMKNQIKFNGKTSTLRYSRQGPAHTIHVYESPNFKYSVDFVPAILLQPEQSVIADIAGNWEAIPKPLPNNTPSYTSFRASYYRQENQILKNKKQLKNAYRMLKKFRDGKSNMLKLKSYFIKTLFLFKAQQESANYWEKPISVIIIDMFMMLEQSLQNERLAFFWNKKLNLYDRYSPRLMREMLNCVGSSREMLEKASQNLTISLQNRVYAVFLTSYERQLLEGTNAKVTINNEPLLLVQTNDAAKTVNSQSEKSKSSCIIS